MRIRRREPALVVSVVVLSILAANAAQGLEVKINFQPSTAQVPAGYLPDFGEVFGDRGNGFRYGWDADIQGDARQRGRNSDPRYDTVLQMQEGDPRTWEIELPNGGYSVFLAAGDPAYDDQIDTLDVEGKIVTDPDGRSNYDEYTVTAIVRDGRLTIKPAPGGTKCKLLFLHITKVELLKAYDPSPASGAIYADSWVTLTWAPGDYAASHNVYFSDNLVDIVLGSSKALRAQQAETSFTVGKEGHPFPDGLVPGKTYYWRVDEVNDLRAGSPWKGDTWNFKIPLGAAYNPSPRDGAEFIDPDVTLSWTPGLGARSHTVYIGDDLGRVDNATGGAAQTDTTYTPGSLAKGTVYYWRVDEFDGVNTYQGPVWRLTTIPSMPITDPNLLCWWKFDESAGDTAIDYSGYDHFGTVHGAALEANGRVGGALYFGGDGDYVVDEDAGEYLNGLNALSVCLWIKSDEVGTDRGFLDGEEPDGGDQVVTMRYDAAGASYGGTNVVKMAVLATPNWQQQLESSSNVQTTQWQHVAMTWSRGQPLRFYIDGIENKPSGTSEPGAGGTITGVTKMIVGKGGKDQGTTAGWKGLIDDVRFYNIVLTAEDIRQVMRGESDLAWDPGPANGSMPDRKRALPLTWRSGENAVAHDVYLGMDQDAVALADRSDTTGIYRGRQSSTSYAPPEGIEWAGGPYYWRIDEHNTDGTITKGRLWQFTVADFILVDDFESYNDLDIDQDGSHRIFLTWIDGWGTQTNGATVGYTEPDFAAGGHFVETDIVHDGHQAMPYFYNNSVGTSEATMALTYPRDWTQEDVQVLTLWFRGYPAAFLEEPAGTYMLSAAGSDIAGTADQFRYVYRRLSGAGSIQAQVLSVQNTHEWAKAGVMIRRTLEPGSPFAAVYVTPGYGCRFQGRLVLTGDVTSDSPVATPEQTALTAPCWVKLERDGANNFNGYYSSDGLVWTAMTWNPQKIQMPQDVYVGLALTSHNANAVCKAQFASVRVAGTVAPAAWTNEAIGATMPSNDPEPMYVAVSSGARRAVVYHEDPRAAQLDTWIPWNINLSLCSDQGVDLTNVTDIGIGFGGPTGLSTGGSGLVYFDDIRLHRAP
jgi:hypothetical protein